MTNAVCQKTSSGASYCQLPTENKATYLPNYYYCKGLLCECSSPAARSANPEPCPSLVHTLAMGTCWLTPDMETAPAASFLSNGSCVVVKRSSCCSWTPLRAHMTNTDRSLKPATAAKCCCTVQSAAEVLNKVQARPNALGNCPTATGVHGPAENSLQRRTARCSDQLDGCRPVQQHAATAAVQAPSSLLSCPRLGCMLAPPAQPEDGASDHARPHASLLLLF